MESNGKVNALQSKCIIENKSILFLHAGCHIINIGFTHVTFNGIHAELDNLTSGFYLSFS